MKNKFPKKIIVTFSSPPLSPVSGTKKRPPGVPPGVPPTLTDEEKDDDDYEDDYSDSETGKFIMKFKI